MGSAVFDNCETLEPVPRRNVEDELDVKVCEPFSFRSQGFGLALDLSSFAFDVGESS